MAGKLEMSPVAPRPGERVETTPEDDFEQAVVGPIVRRIRLERDLRALVRDLASEACRTAAVIADPVKQRMYFDPDHVDCGECLPCRARKLVTDESERGREG